MEYTLSELRRDVAIDMLDDEEYDAGIIDRALNKTQREIFNQFELTFQEKIFSGTIPTASTMFKYPTDLALAQDHIVTSPDGQQSSLKHLYIPFERFNQMYPTPANNKPGPITAWTSYGGNIITSAPTDQEYTIDFYYIKKPALLKADTDVPEIPEEFSELLVLGAYIRIAKRNEDLDLANVAVQDYAAMLNKLVERYGYRMTGPIKMKSTQRKTR